MEDVSENSASNPDAFLNNVPVSAVSSVTPVEETETQSATEFCNSKGELSEEETGSQASDRKASDEIMDSVLGGGDLLPVVEGSGETSGETVQCREMNNQDESESGIQPQLDNDSGTEEDTTQSCSQLSENSGSTCEVSAANEDMDINLSEKNDSSGQGAGVAEITSEAGSTSTAANVDQHSELVTGHENKTGIAKSATSSTEAQQVLESIYHIKWIKWKGINTPVITQNENGPCPLLAIVNVLLLQRRINIPTLQEIVTSEQLMEYIGDCILEEAPKVCVIESCFVLKKPLQ